MSIALKAHDVIGCKGVTRSDFKFHKNKFYLLPQIVCASGIFAISIYIVPTNYTSVLKFLIVSLILTLVLYFCIHFFVIRRN